VLPNSEHGQLTLTVRVMAPTCLALSSVARTRIAALEPKPGKTPV